MDGPDGPEMAVGDSLANEPAPAAATATIVLAGVGSGVGKTSLAVGIMAALRRRGLVVQAFKVGPDFADPARHELATGRPSSNLDCWMLGRGGVAAAFARAAAGADVAVVEGAAGLFDGARGGASEDGSTAQLAKWLGAPVALVVDCSAAARSVAALVAGFAAFDEALRLEALLLNKVGPGEHAAALRAAVAAAGCRLAVLGSVPKEDAVAAEERHPGLGLNLGLGLHLPGLHLPGDDPADAVAAMAALVEEHVDLDALLALAATARAPAGEAGEPAAAAAPRGEAPSGAASTASGGDGSPTAAAAAAEQQLARQPPQQQRGGKKKKKRRPQQPQLLRQALEGAAAPPPAAAPASPPPPLPPPPAGPPVRLAVARDAAFCHYYADNLALLEAAGCELVPFSPLAGEGLPPECAGVYLGGGFPERHAADLADNRLLRAQLAAHAAAGGVVYAECGGLVFLAASLQPRGQPPQPMAAVFPFKAVVPRGGGLAAGYVEVETTADNPLFPPGLVLRGHARHFTELVVEERLCGATVGPAPAAGGAAAGAPARPWRAGYVARPQAPGAAPAPEGFACGAAVLASYVHLHFGGCPALAGHIAARCRGVDARAVAAAVAGAPAEAALLDGALVAATPPLSSLGGGSVVGGGAPSLGGLTTSHSSPDFHRAPHHHHHHYAHARYGGGGAPHLHHHHARAYSGGGGSVAGGRSRSLDPLHSWAAAAAAATAPRGAPPPEPLGLAGGGGAPPPLLMHPDAASAAAAAAAAYAPKPLGPSPGTTLAHEPSLESLSTVRGAGAAPRRASAPAAAPPPRAAALAGGAASAPGGSPGALSSPRCGSDAFAPGGSGSGAAGFLSPDDDGGVEDAGSAGAPPPPPHAFLFGGAAAGDGVVVERQGSGGGGAYPPASRAHFSAAPPGRRDVAPPGEAPAPAPAPARPGSAPAAAPPPPPPALPGRLDLSGVTAGAGLPAGAPATARLEPPLGSGRAPSSRLPSWRASGAATPHGWEPRLPPSDRVVSLGPSATEMLWALGLGGRVVAVSERCDWPPEAGGRAKAAGARASPRRPSPRPGGGARRAPARGAADAEWRVDDRVLAWERPGLVVYESDDESGGEDEGGGAGDDGAASEAGSERPDSCGRRGAAVAEAVAAAGLQGACRAVGVRHACLAGVFESMLAVGDAAGAADEAARAVERLRSRLRATAAEAGRAAAARGRPPRVLLLASLAPLATVGRWGPDLVGLAGGLDGLQVPGDAPRRLEWADVVAYAPEVLVIAGLQRRAFGGGGGGAGGDSGRSAGANGRLMASLCELAGRPGWWALPAVRAGAVYAADAALFCRAGPRLVDGVEALARMAHGDAVGARCPPRSCLKLGLRPGQRCRPRLVSNYFVAY